MRVLSSSRASVFLLWILVFILMLDPTNTIFHVKEIVYVLFFCFAIFHNPVISQNMLAVVLLFFLFLFASVISGMMQGFLFDKVFLLSNVKTLSFLTILFFVKDYDYIKPLTVASFFVALVTIIVAHIFLSRYPISTELYSYFSAHDHFIKYTPSRKFIGYSVPFFFYKTSPALVLPLSFSLYRFFFSYEKKPVNLLLFLLFFSALMLSGTRANILSAILITGFIALLRLNKSYFWRPLVKIVLVIAMIAVGVLISKLLSDANEASIQIKTDHIISIMAQIKSNPLILVGGQGVGSMYYSGIYGEYICQSELTYLEIVRMYGLLMGGCIIAIFFAPLYIAYKRRKGMQYFAPFFISYLAYLFIGGTNPLLFSSTGILVLCVAYSIALTTKDNNNEVNYSDTTRILVI